MSDRVKIVFSKSYWKYVFSLKRTIISLLGALGVLWLLVETSSFFSPQVSAWWHAHWYCFMIAGLIWAIAENRPRHVICHRLSGRDITLEIRVGDLFRQDGGVIIGSNTTFDTELGDHLISRSSVQGQFTQRFYQNIQHLDQDLDKQLATVSSTLISTSKAGKSKQYPVGTVAKISPGGKNTYLIAVATINEHGIASATFEDVKVSLASIWEFIGSHGTLERLSMPIIGTGFSRLTQTRDEVVKEIINSFVAACASSRFCERLTIVIPVRDFYEHEIDMGELQEYLKFVCKYTQAKSPQDRGGGTPTV